MNQEKCVHILLKGPRKGNYCNKNAWFPFFYKCFCKQHALLNNVPISYEETNLFIKNIKNKLNDK